MDPGYAYIAALWQWCYYCAAQMHGLACIPKSWLCWVIVYISSHSDLYRGAKAKVLLTALGRMFSHQSNRHNPLISLYGHKAVSKTLALAPANSWGLRVKNDKFSWAIFNLCRLPDFLVQNFTPLLIKLPQKLKLNYIAFT